MTGGAGPLFEDGKDQGAMRTIGEVSAAFGIKPHVLRYWEQQFPMLEPLKRSGGRRLYRQQDLKVVEAIDRLVNREGYTLKGAKMALEQGGAQAGRSAASGDAPASPATAGVTGETARQLRAIRDRLEAALAA
ncbi:MerR family transcriptional regulator [Erythrobacter arachoides]|uniref:MerR family transcriptional regulator n=1 Tax=Aurantiacibacter arachoides TaxID=1850444 RepID=A0A845A218_9SPHN|nr:MerR family transcriptional regulator [Aurantiacibacter arachoides]MXO93492.1 MerR family transcriptional regulator [Aurantiacibacter arachoides]GGD48936.1 hypothetical protein GCM10011411_05900 [Aurantiacibacter arachoides]